ncbi:fungal-specific transcription factor [Ilyonectria destructans]|nr:fungal-specific transcription factor [Ilyonectria destructans]
MDQQTAPSETSKSPENHGNKAKSTRKRATKACLSCRRRKVRCDASVRGIPCMNCYLDSEDCVIVGRAGKSCRTPECVDHGSSKPVTTAKCRSQKIDKDEVGVGLNAAANSRTIQEAADRTAIEETQSHASSPESITPCVDSKLDDAPTRRTGHGDTNNDPPYVFYSYYPFISIGNLHNLSTLDVSFLEMQGCLRVPTRPVLDELVQQYFLHVHPVLPLLNEGDFWDLYYGNTYETAGADKKLSLLVIQAIIFATCVFVSPQCINALGFSTIKAARLGLFRVAKLLYDLEAESSSVSISQAALLLSFWATSSNQGLKKRNTTWLSIAIQHARIVEAHQYEGSTSKSPLATPNTLKRLWWCCVMRDRILPLCCRRSIQITRTDFNFEAFSSLSYEDLESEVHRSTVYNAETKKTLIQIIVQTSELCIVLTDVLLMAYPPDDAPCHGRLVLSEEVLKIKDCKLALRRWNKQASCYFPPFQQTEVVKCQHESVTLYRDLMYMYYHTAGAALCHHELLLLTAAPSPKKAYMLSPLSFTPAGDLSKVCENRHELQDAVIAVTECLKELTSLGLARWLPISAVACTALPLVLHMLDAELSSAHSDDILPPGENTMLALKKHRLTTVVQAMMVYHAQYDAVDFVSRTMRHIVDLVQHKDSVLRHSSPESEELAKGVKIDWTDLLTAQPSCYLRLVFTMDLSLSKDRLAGEGDFPATLRGIFRENGKPSTSLATEIDHRRLIVEAPSVSSASSLLTPLQSTENISPNSVCSATTETYMTNEGTPDFLMEDFNAEGIDFALFESIRDYVQAPEQSPDTQTPEAVDFGNCGLDILEWIEDDVVTQ